MINFDELMNLEVAESLSFEPLPEGQYKVTVDACELGESKAGKPMYTVDFVVTEGDHASRQVRYWLVLVTKKGLHWDLPKFCEASGNAWPDEPTKRNEAYFNQVALDLVGKTATITVAIEEREYNGEMRKNNNIKKVEWDEAKTKKKSKATRIEL
jgi:hypothetical protein|nr:MAG TPA: Protein of unknown function (DUF669) [Caudoviricetes sp.]